VGPQVFGNLLPWDPLASQIQREYGLRPWVPPGGGVYDKCVDIFTCSLACIDYESLLTLEGKSTSCATCCCLVPMPRPTIPTSTKLKTRITTCCLLLLQII
jgi:hypothetical protein